MKLEALFKMEKAGRVKRVHTEPLIGEHTVAEHCYGVANLLIWITCGEVSAALLKTALNHDIAEQLTGDVPAPAKWANVALNGALTQMSVTFEEALCSGVFDPIDGEDVRLMKWADMLDFAMFALYQMRMGNTYAADLMQQCLQWGEDEDRSPTLDNAVHWSQVKKLMKYLRYEFTRLTIRG